MTNQSIGCDKPNTSIDFNCGLGPQELLEKNLVINLDDRKTYNYFDYNFSHIVFESNAEKIRIPKKYVFEKLKLLFPEFMEPK